MNGLWHLIACIEHEHGAIGGECNPYIDNQSVEAKSIILWYAASQADSAFCFKRMARRWWIHAAKHPEDAWVKSVNKIYIEQLAKGATKDQAELKAFFRRPGRFKPLLKLKASITYNQFRSKYHSDDKTTLYNRIYRKLRKHGAKSPENIKKIIQSSAKQKYLNILSV